MSLADFIGTAITSIILVALHTWHVNRIQARNRTRWQTQAAWLHQTSMRLTGIEAEHQAENRAALDLARAADRLRDEWAESSPDRQQELWSALHDASEVLRHVIDAHHTTKEHHPMSTAPPPATAVPCPRCGAEAGAPCTSHGGTRVRRHDVHQDRTAAHNAQEATR